MENNTPVEVIGNHSLGKMIESLNHGKVNEPSITSTGFKTVEVIEGFNPGEVIDGLNCEQKPSLSGCLTGFGKTCEKFNVEVQHLSKDEQNLLLSLHNEKRSMVTYHLPGLVLMSF
jgi:hypothetical protein